MSAPSNQIYSAKYSGVEVYEFIHPTGSIMKRKADDWVNATHILKAAKFAKAKRTRILEKEVIKDIHEKVQGGFGKYQGTWVPLDIARKLASKFDVMEELKPLFDFTQRDGSASPPQAPKHHHASRSDSSRKKATKSASTTTSKVPEPSSSSASVTPTNVPKRRGRPPSKNKKLEKAPKFQRSQSEMTFPRPMIPNSNITSTHLPSIQSPLLRTTSLDPVVMGEGPESPVVQQQRHFKELDIEDGLSSDIEQSQVINKEVSSSSSLPTSPSELSETNPFDNRHDMDSVTSPIASLVPRFSSQPQSSDVNTKVSEYLSKLVDFFITSETHSDLDVPVDLLSPPPHSSPYIDYSIDPEGHTAFHWACAMGNIAIAEALYNVGASTRSVNTLGETPLMRSSIFHNSYTKRTYPKICHLLQDTTYDVDSQLQTVIHHIVRRKSSTPSAVYYLDVLLSKIKDFSPQYRIESLINAQDQRGNTALHVAAFNDDRIFFNTLLEHGALSTIKNNEGTTADEILTSKYSTNVSATTSISGNGRHKVPIVPTSPSDFLMYPSQAATRLSRGIPQIVNVMKDLADTYSKLYQERDADARNLERTLKSMSKTVSTVEFKILEVLQLDNVEDVIPLLEKKSTEVKELQEKVNYVKKEMIRRLERGQCKRLATYMKDEESEIDGEQENSMNLDEKVKLLKEMAILQLRRKRKLEDMLNYVSDNTKIHKYRKMISQGTEMDIDEVDGCLGVILQSLANE